MKKNLTKVLALVMAVLMVGALAACGNSSTTTTAAAGGDTTAAAETAAGGETQAASDINIGVVVKTATNAHFQDISYGAAIAANELGIKVTIQNTSTEADVDGQITLCENLIAAGVDALVLTANDSDGMTVAVESAHEAGIPFVTVDTEITNVWGDAVKEYLPNYIGVVHEDMARRLALDAFENAPGEGKDLNVIILEGVEAATSSQQRTAGFNEAIEEAGANLLISQSAHFDQDEATQTMADFLQNPEYQDVDVVLCCNDLMAVGAVTALEEAGYKVGGDDGVIVVGIDGNLLALQSIKDGKIYGTAYDWSLLQGYYAVYQAYALIMGEEVPSYTWTGDTIVTAENVDDFMQHSEELAAWKMGDPVTSVSDYMNAFIETGDQLTVYED